jgi:polysaccharide transporter, PST family
VTTSSPRDRSGSASVRWNAVGVAAKTVLVAVISILIARLLGPHAVGTVGQASVFVLLTALVLEQGMAAALIQKPEVDRALVRAAAGLNLSIAVLLGVVLMALSGVIGDFFRNPALAPIVLVLGGGLVLKGWAVVPRAMLMRELDFKGVTAADVTGTVLGGVVGLVSALLGLGSWSLVLQVLVSDLTTSTMFNARAGWMLPSLRFRALRGTIGFSSRVFGANLISYFSRNSDNILIGRFYGAAQLAYYSLAYRVLLAPVQTLGRTIVQVLFPHMARASRDRARIASAVLKCFRTLAAIVFPVMAIVGASAPQSVLAALGPSWTPAIGPLMVLAFTGARQSLAALNAPVLLAAGRADLHLRYSFFTSAVQVAGIVAGLPFGILGVAWGYTIAGLLLTPFTARLICRFTDLRYRDVGAAIVPPLHGCLWVIGVYIAFALIGLPPWPTLLIGGTLSGITYVVVLRFAHRKFFTVLLADLGRVGGRAEGPRDGRTATPTLG